MKLLFSLLLLTGFLPSMAQEQYMIVGTYDSPKSEGVYVFRFNSATGKATEISHIKTPNPSFVAVSPDERFVYAVHEVAPQDGKGGEIVAFTFNKQNGTLTPLNKQLSGGDHPCHVEMDKTGKWVFASNYGSGSLSVLPVNADGSLGVATVIWHSGSGKNPARQKGPHVHGAIISPDNKQLFVTDLGIDKVMIYSFDAATGQLTTGKQPYSQSEPGSGPRIFSFHPTNRFAYVIEELTGTVSVYEYKKGKLKTKQRISTMPAGDTTFAGSGFVQASPDGKFLYASNRGNVNTIAIYRIQQGSGTLVLVGHQSTLIKTPRNFSIDPSGKFLLCENQGSDEIVIFKRDETTGLLSDSGNRIKVGKPVCIKWIAER
ncbi:MAG TPA: lactonase family protein [Chitinophagaceae bacterium]|jgi:6-phosphogluconolactonase|nr:lactonase family protein [Chitinophagaceae bacterium]